MAIPGSWLGVAALCVIVQGCSGESTAVSPRTTTPVGPDGSAVEWLKEHSSALATTDPGAALTDLEPLRAMIGDARLVGLGEGTHGTREFFRMKHRIFRYLVEEEDFTHFAIEATWPESNKINRYVLTGEGGDPARLIRDMYFWTWDTYEVLDLVNWMRQWNTSASADRRVQFLGFDMQYPGMAIDTVNAFIARVSPSHSLYVSQHLACIARYRNFGWSFPVPVSGYTSQGSAVKTACRDSLAQVPALFLDNGGEFSSVSSDEEYARALQSARLIQQFEAMHATTGRSTIVRDSAMAENVSWLLSRAGADTRMVLWAHNYHVGRSEFAMGRHLFVAHGNAYRNLGFLFGGGSFTAVDSVRRQLLAQTVSIVPESSIEAYFGAVGHPIALFDTRRLMEAGAPELMRAIPMRSIGAIFDARGETDYFVQHRFPADLDLLIYVANTSASLLLP